MIVECRRWVLVGLVMFFMTTGLSGEATASHYRLLSLDFLDDGFLEALHGQGIETTEEFLVQTLEPSSRRALSERSGIDEHEIVQFSRMCELLQIEGVGPRVARLLRASGVVSVADLASRDPVELEQVVAAVNAVEHLTGLDPSAENLAEWIDSASTAEHQIR